MIYSCFHRTQKNYFFPYRTVLIEEEMDVAKYIFDVVFNEWPERKNFVYSQMEFDVLKQPYLEYLYAVSNTAKTNIYLKPFPFSVSYSRLNGLVHIHMLTDSHFIEK